MSNHKNDHNHATDQMLDATYPSSPSRDDEEAKSSMPLFLFSWVLRLLSTTEGTQRSELDTVRNDFYTSME